MPEDPTKELIDDWTGVIHDPEAERKSEIQKLREVNVPVGIAIFAFIVYTIVNVTITKSQLSDVAYIVTNSIAILEMVVYVLAMSLWNEDPESK